MDTQASYLGSVTYGAAVQASLPLKWPQSNLTRAVGNGVVTAPPPARGEPHNKRPSLASAGRRCRGRGGVSQSKQAAGGPPRSDKWESRNGASCSVSFGPLHVSLFAMSARCFLLLLWAVSAQADFFHFDSISNVSTYYFNYIYCNIWEGECQPNQDDATQQGKRW